MTQKEFESAYADLGDNLKTRDIDAFNKRLIKERADVSFLRPVVSCKDQYFRTYFHVSMAYRESTREKMAFVEDNFDLLQDWWHTDCLIPMIGKVEFSYALEKAKAYVKDPRPYVRRWGYVLFIPRLVRDPGRIEPIFGLFHNDEVYHVVMAQAWLLSYLAMCAPERTWAYLRHCDLSYDIVGRAIQKICDSYAVPQETKAYFKTLRPLKRR